MDFTEYQENAYSTCTPECYTAEYLRFGYISEVGEVAGKIAKRIRGDVVSDKDIMLELGDCAWMAAVDTRRLGVLLVLEDYVKRQYDILSMATSFPVCQIEQLLFFCNTPPILRFYAVKECCEKLHYDFQTCLRMNNEKLASRNARGKILGNGDDR